MFNTLFIAMLALGMTQENVDAKTPFAMTETVPEVYTDYSHYEKATIQEIVEELIEMTEWLEEQARLEEIRQEELARKAAEEAAQKERARAIQVEKTRVASITRAYYTSSDVTTKSNLTSTELDKVFYGTGLQGLGSSFIKAEEKYGVNAVFLSSIAILESGWGNSTFARERNNLFGIKAYDSNPNNATYFSSKYEAIMYTANHLSRNYLNSNGKYYNGRTPSGVNVMYCSGNEWAGKVVRIMNSIVSKATS